MVIFPICLEAHWFLIIAVKPGLIKVQQQQLGVFGDRLNPRTRIAMLYEWQLRVKKIVKAREIQGRESWSAQPPSLHIFPMTHEKSRCVVYVVTWNYISTNNNLQIIFYWLSLGTEEPGWPAHQGRTFPHPSWQHGRHQNTGSISTLQLYNSKTVQCLVRLLETTSDWKTQSLDWQLRRTQCELRIIVGQFVMLNSWWDI